MNYVLLGNHPAIQKIRELVTMVSDTAFTVLIMGETGTGKEVVARLLHQASSRKDKTFVKVNCAALPLTLLESELFGYEKGAFTGADKFKPGKFELASDGVIFLDEIGDMPLILQAKLLQVLQSGEFARLGGTRDVKVNSWVISATNHNLEQDMKRSLFREDLFYRLNIIKIEIPPLRERRGDLTLLISHFIQRHSQALKLKDPFKLDGTTKKLFQLYQWPGNVRELSSILLKLMVGDDPEQVREEMIVNMKAEGLPIPEDIVPSSEKVQPHSAHDEKKMERLPSLKDLKAEASDYIEKRAILHALNMTSWNKRQAAKMLKISYKALFYKMSNLGIEKRSNL